MAIVKITDGILIKYQYDFLITGTVANRFISSIVALRLGIATIFITGIVKWVRRKNVPFVMVRLAPF
jgi:hypothetical protein